MNTSSQTRVSVGVVHYRGWPDSYRIANELVEAVIVPQIGRVMRFSRIHGPNVLWEDESLDGTRHGVDAEGWANFGGDKIWPSPQSEWEKLTSRPWPPPAAFDSVPYDARIEATTLIVTSPVDEHFGIQTVRRITLLPGEPVLTISTKFRKLQGGPVRAGIWVITQLRDPVRVFALLPEGTPTESAYVSLTGPAPAGLSVDGRLLSLVRDPVAKLKIGLKAGNLLWIGKEDALRIDVPPGTGEFPDQDSRTEIYTNSDPLPYVELEAMAPLTAMKTGDSTEWTTTYTLRKRSRPDVQEEARQAFGIE